MTLLDRIRPDLAGFVPYASARRVGLVAPIRLDANESAWCHDPAAPLNRYPMPQPPALRESIASLYGVDADRVWMGRGSDEAIDLLVRAFCRAGQDNIVSLAPTFGMYRIAARLQGAGYRSVTLEADDGFALDPQRLLDAVDANTKIVVLCSPNNPTGTLHHAAIGGLATRLAGRCLLLVDEAYIDFAGVEDAASLLDAHENLAILRTLSKAHAMAGARVGVLLAQPALIELVVAIAAPYPLPTPSIDAAMAALSTDAIAVTRARVTTIIAERERVRAALDGVGAVERIWPSAGNFLLVRCRDAGARFKTLLDAGILVRDVSGQPGLANCLRVGIGRPEENDAVLAAFDVGTVRGAAVEAAA